MNDYAAAITPKTGRSYQGIESDCIVAETEFLGAQWRPTGRDAESVSRHDRAMCVFNRLVSDSSVTQL